MNNWELMEARHSVRRFTPEPLSADAVAALTAELDAINRESGLHLQLITEEPEAFQAQKPEYGSFAGCKNYFALAGPKGRDEDIGYYGEHAVLAAQAKGVNSCWVALTYKKGKAAYALNKGEKLYMVIALGYGVTQGHPHRSKAVPDVSDHPADAPEWYLQGVKAALLAPTAVNQQKFRFALRGDRVQAKAGLGFYSRVDLGIAKYHFELGAEKGREIWD